MTAQARVWQRPDGTLIVHEDSPSYGRDVQWIAGTDQPPSDAVPLHPVPDVTEDDPRVELLAFALHPDWNFVESESIRERRRASARDLLARLDAAPPVAREDTASPDEEALQLGQRAPSWLPLAPGPGDGMCVAGVVDGWGTCSRPKSHGGRHVAVYAHGRLRVHRDREVIGLGSIVPAQPTEAPDVQSAAPTRDALADAFLTKDCIWDNRYGWSAPGWREEAERMADVALGVLRGGGADGGRIAGLRYVLSLPDEWSSGEVLDAARVWIAANVKKEPQTEAREPSGQCDVCSAPLYNVCARLDDGGKACSARCVDLARLARAAGVSPDSEDVVGAIEAAIRAGREPEVVTGAEAMNLGVGSRLVQCDDDGIAREGFKVIDRMTMGPPHEAKDLRWLVLHRVKRVEPPPAPMFRGEIVTGARAVSAPVGTKLGAKSAAMAAVHTVNGWSVTGLKDWHDHEHAVRINEWVVLALGEGSGA